MPVRIALGLCRAVLAVLCVGALLATSALAASELVATPDKLDFGAQIPGSDTIKTVTVTNRGPDVLLSDIYLVGDVDPFDFFGGSCQPGVTLGAEGQCSLSLTFSPFVQEVAGYETLLVVEGGEADTPAVAHLVGNVPPGRLASNVASVDFGALVTGRVSAPRTIRIHNAGGTPVMIDYIYADRAFALASSGCRKAVSLAPFQTCDLEVAMKRGNPVTREHAARQGALTIRTRLASQRLSIPLSGVVLQPSGEPYPTAQEVSQSVRRNLGRIARTANRRVRGGPKGALELPGFDAPVEGTLDLATYGRVGRRKVLLMTTTADATVGARRIGLRPQMTAAGRRLLRGAKPVAVRSVVRFRSSWRTYPLRKRVVERATVRPVKPKRKRR